MVKNLLHLKEKTILFAEDDIITRQHMEVLLSIIFKKVFTACDGKEAYRIYEEESPDIILTDIKMPQMDGIALIEKIRSCDYETPVILLTSFAEQEMLLNATNLSIDGYLIKPASLETLTSSVSKAIERSQNEMGIISLSSELFYHADTKELYRNGSVVKLGLKEAMLLELLVMNPQKTLTKSEIEKNLWPLESINTSTIKKLVLRIRQKIKVNIITSVRGIGYRINCSCK